MLNLLKRIFRRKPSPQIIDDPPLSAATKASVEKANSMIDAQTKRMNPPPPEEHSIFAVGQVITINGLPFRVARFGERELHLRLEGRGKLVSKKRPARRAKARRKR